MPTEKPKLLTNYQINEGINRVQTQMLRKQKNDRKHSQRGTQSYTETVEDEKYDGYKLKTVKLNEYREDAYGKIQDMISNARQRGLDIGVEKIKESLQRDVPIQHIINVDNIINPKDPRCQHYIDKIKTKISNKDRFMSPQ